jgi:hypothetical protein
MKRMVRRHGNTIHEAFVTFGAAFGSESGAGNCGSSPDTAVLSAPGQRARRDVDRQERGTLVADCHHVSVAGWGDGLRLRAAVPDHLVTEALAVERDAGFGVRRRRQQTLDGARAGGRQVQVDGRRSGSLGPTRSCPIPIGVSPAWLEPTA